MDNQGTKKAAAVFASAFAASFAESLSQAAGSSFQLRVLESPDLATRQGQPVHFRLTAEGGLRGQCFVELYRPQVATLAAKIQGVPVEEFSGEQADALEPAISAAMAGTAEALSAEYGGVTFKVERVEDLAFGGMFVVPLAASAEEYPEIAVLLYFDGQLLNALAPASAKTDAAAAGSISVDATNLKLVLDVELNMSLRFGQRQLPLRDVLELASGSVIELDRQVDDPVELLLDGKVIARGEAVIVDGNYGLRVTEVPQPIASQLGY